MAPLLAGRASPTSDDDAAARARDCGAPTTGEVCAFCRLVETASRATTPVPVELIAGDGRDGDR